MEFIQGNINSLFFYMLVKTLDVIIDVSLEFVKYSIIGLLFVK